MKHKKLLATVASFGLVAGGLLSTSAPAFATDLEGAVGDIQPWSEDTNHTSYWEDLYDLPEGSCVKYDADDNGDSSGAEGYSSGKTVTLYDGVWTLLVVKGGNVSNNVIVDPEPGVAYASTVNNGGQQSNVSHWIVCSGLPDTAVATATPVAYCAEGGSVTFFTENATWDDDSDTTDGSRDATSDAGYTFPGGSTTITVTYTIPGPDSSMCDLATASLAFTPASCSAAQAPNIGGSSISNATWGTDTDPSALGYSIVATANSGAEFADGDGDPGNLTKTFTGALDPVRDGDDCEEDPDVATASLAFTPASCSAAESPNIGGSSITNATWGADTDPSALGYSIVATANSGAEFADGDPGNLTKTFTGTLDPMRDGESCEEEPDVATASLAFTPASCLAAQAPNIGGSSISNATWGTDTDPSALGYSIVATANSGAEFADGDGDPGNLTKTFTGTLDAIFPDGDPRCPGVLGLVMPAVTFAQSSCAAAGSYTLGVAKGYDPTHVTFTVNGVPNVLAGTYPVTGALLVTVTAQPVAPNGLEFDWVNPPAFKFVAPAACGQLTTLALTGAAVSYLGWGVGGGALFLGAALMFMRRRSEATGE